MTPPVDGALLRAALEASCLRGALPPVDLRAVCLVRAIAANVLMDEDVVDVVVDDQIDDRWGVMDVVGVRCKRKKAKRGPAGGML